MLTFLHIYLKCNLMQKPRYLKTEKYATKKIVTLLKYYFFD